MIKVAIVDDHAILREGIKFLLAAEPDILVCAECDRPSQLEGLLDSLMPQVLIMDLNMPEGGGFPLLEKVRASNPDLHVVVLSAHDSPSFVSKALAFGCGGYVTKSRANLELVLAIRAVMTGNRFLSSDLRHGKSAGGKSLSQRETEVLNGLIQGRNPKALALEMGIADKTLYAHRSNIMRKLQARNLQELHEIALASGLL